MIALYIWGGICLLLFVACVFAGLLAIVEGSRDRCAERARKQELRRHW